MFKTMKFKEDGESDRDYFKRLTVSELQELINFWRSRLPDNLAHAAHGTANNQYHMLKCEMAERIGRKTN